MKRTIVTIIAALTLLLPKTASAADASRPSDDGGSWCSLQLMKPVNKAYLMLRAEHRSNSKFSKTECWFLMGGAGYKFTPWLASDLSYEYWSIAGNPYHKAVLGVTGTLRQGNLAVSLREKYELCMSRVAATNSTLRSRLRAQYMFPQSAFKPYLMAEVFTWDAWKRSLYYVGTDIVLGRVCSLDVFYCYHLQASGPAVHTAGLGLTLTF